MREIDFRTILQRVINGWSTIVIAATLAVIFALYSLHNAPTVYRVSMQVLPAPADRPGESGGSATASALGSLLGVTNGSVGSDYIRYQRLMGSTAVAQRMQDKDGMLQYVFANGWDAREKKWKDPPATMRSMLLGWLFILSHVPMSPQPDVTALAEYVQAHVLIIPSPTTDIITVEMESPKIEFAKRIMLTAHEEANSLLRDQIARRSKQQVDYLQAKLMQTSVTDYRATLLALLSQQEKTLMLTQTSASFAAEIISPPTASLTPVSPRPVLWVAVAILVGSLVGCALVIFFGADWWRQIYLKLIAVMRHSNAKSRLARRTS